MNQIFKTLLLVSAIVLPLLASAQKSLKKADKQFDLKAYDLSIESYKLALEEDEECQKCIYKIAEAYRLQNESLEAAVWYRKITDQSVLPEDYTLNYGLMMKKMGQFEKAKDLFYEYQSVNPVLGAHYAQSCDFAMKILSDQPNYDISLYKGSSDQADYGVTFFQDKLVYSSFRKDILRDLARNDESLLNPLGSQLFITTPGLESKAESIEYLRPDADETFDVASISFSPSGKFCAFTKSNYAKSGMEVTSVDEDMHIYFGKVQENGNFYSEIAFTHNEIGFSNGYPSLSFDGKALYFASNRPGGHGGYDIYVSYYKNQDWTYPENLGPNINSQGNEITPFLNGSELYFSSDFLMGVGGFDIFKSEVVGTSWSEAKNAGNGVNSPEDEFYPSVQPETELVYFSSNRIGGRGGYDIYVGSPIYRNEMVDLNSLIEEQIPAAVALDEEPQEEPSPVAVSQVKDKFENGVSPVSTAVSTSEIQTETVVSTPNVNQGELESTPTYSDVPPKAVDLEELQRKTTMGTVSVSDAKKVSYGEVVNDNSLVYFIQLAALYSSTGTVLPFKNLIDYGNIYKTKTSKVTKIKLGYFYDQYEADRVLSQVKGKGFGDAFITQDVLNGGDMELLVNKNDNNVNFGEEHTSGYSSGTQYKVRLAAYEDPIWFEVNKVKDLGVIEQWSKKDWTIFVLSGYSGYDDANSAKIAALNRGFADAEVVVDNDGVLETIKSH